jgi:hypothetical protein
MEIGIPFSTVVRIVRDFGHSDLPNPLTLPEIHVTKDSPLGLYSLSAVSPGQKNTVIVNKIANSLTRVTT